MYTFSCFRYVIRRILRRGIRYCTEKLGAKPGVFAGLVNTVVEVLVSYLATPSHSQHTHIQAYSPAVEHLAK